MSTVETRASSHPAFFITHTPYVLPPQKYMIPATWRRYQLSQLINKVLSLAQPVPFDFLIKGDVVRTSIGEWCAEHGVEEEDTLEIEYVESLMPPQRTASIPQEEWTSSVSCQAPGYILAGSYDAHVRIFDAAQQPVHDIPGHSAAVTSVCWVGAERHLIASASHDRTARLVRVPELHGGAPEPLASLHLHTTPISSVASDRLGTRLVTGGWDTLIGVWDTSIPEKDELPAEEIIEDRKKRRRIAEAGPRVVRKAPVHVMKSHTDRISRVLFSSVASEQHITYSCGLDSTFRTWDANVGICTSTMTLSEKPFTDLALLADGNTALCASTDRTVPVLDIRQASTTLPTLSLVHPALPSALVAHPADTQRAMSGAYDGVVRLWDLRSVKVPVAAYKAGTAKGGEGKILSVDWGKGVGAVGGEDGIEVWKIGEGGERSSAQS